MTQQYQTRAECIQDVIELIQHVPMESFTITSHDTRWLGVSVSFQSTEGYDAIQAAMNHIPDSHVMSRCLLVQPIIR